MASSTTEVGARPEIRDERLEDAIRRLDAYHVERVLAEKPGFTTELASRRLANGSTEFLVLKHVAREFANPDLWMRYATVRQAHLPRLVEVMGLPDEYVVVLQFIQGESLDDYVRRRGALDVARARAVMDDLCDAASALAKAGIVHRDIKPSNVVLAFDGAYLIDPGIARVTDGPGADPKDHDTIILGSWGYASPEQLGYAPTDARSDVFSLSRLLGFMVTGLSPTDGRYLESLRDTSRIPEKLRIVIMRSCALEPSERPADAKTLKQLVDIGSQGEVEPLPQPVFETSDPWSATPSSPYQTPSGEAVPAQPSEGKSHRGAIALAIAFFGFFGTYMCFAGFFLAGDALPRWGYILYGFIIGILGNYLPCYEIVRALRGVDIYADDSTRKRTCRKRILVWWAICFGALMLVSFIAQATGWQRPR